MGSRFELHHGAAYFVEYHFYHHVADQIELDIDH